jgi:hypothetical protein
MRTIQSSTGLSDACYQCFDQYKLNKHVTLGTHYVTREISTLAEQASQFLLDSQTRFPTVCHLAGLDPRRVRRHARKVTNDVDLRLKIISPSLHNEPKEPTHDDVACIHHKLHLGNGLWRSDWRTLNTRTGTKA